MEGHKHIFFKRFIKKAVTNLDVLVNFARLLEPKVQACYSEKTKLTKDELVEVILVDGGFIIELFMSYHVKGWSDGDAKFLKQWLEDLVILDLLLLENQLPFFFLEKLFNRAFPFDFREGHDVPSFRMLTYKFFAHYNIQELKPNFNEIIKHFTDLLRHFHLPELKCRRKKLGEAGTDELNYSVSELHEAGVKFKVNKSKCLLDLKFSGHVLEIPHILVEDGTETLFRNMIALEQCHYFWRSDITNYATMLDCLINTIKDVDVLIHEEIIRNYLGDSNEVVKVFNGLGKNIIQSSFNSNYLDICQNINDFYKSPWHNLATLRRDYCKTLWQTAASIAAIVLLILTLVQTIYSVLGYMK